MAENSKALTPEQESVVESKKRRLVVSASAGSGKTFVVVEKLIKLICEENVPVSRLLVLTFTKAAANELKSRLYSEILTKPSSPFLTQQIDDILISDVSTIDAFCEKIIKRNVNKLSLPQNFVVLDEKSVSSLKHSAFKRAFESYSLNKAEDFEEIYFAFKRNDEALEECCLSIQSFFDSDCDGEALFEQFKNNIKTFHEKACKKILEDMKFSIQRAKSLLNEALLGAEMIGENLAKGHVQFAENMKAFLEVDFGAGLFDFARSLAKKSLPALSTAKCDGQVKKKFALSKEEASVAFDMAKLLQNISPEIEREAEKGSLTLKLLEFYKQYESEYRSLKEKRSALDFADLENFARHLLKDDEIKQSLQNRYDYIIIDEYQDTNRLQEALLKPIAEGGFFIAVGDVKQGIYGFRNASKEIMSQDIEEFSRRSDGDALFLRGNFRTDASILNFVNKIFEKLMTKESVGIDYKGTSMLEAKNEFLSNSLPSVRVDVVSKPEDEEKEEGKVWEEVYSVKDDEVCQNLKFREEVLTIASRIEEVLQEKIYSPKTKEYRAVEQGDIALLFRNRSQLMQECVKFLQEKGFSVSADVKENLLEDGQIATIASLIKLSINANDDIALASVMTSTFGGFSLEELANLRENNSEGSFYEIVASCEEEKTKTFFDMIERFKFDLQCFGIIKALERLFAKVGYMDYIQSLPDSALKRNRINKLFVLIREGDLDFSPQGLISQLENAKKESPSATDGGNSITVTTIHATKGLEYPIVFICGCGENLNKAYNKNYIITKEYGLANHLYSFGGNLRLPSPAFLAGKKDKKSREFIDEIMLFYVAMTRAQNHLYLIGSANEKDFSFANIEKQNTYLKMIFFALGEAFTSQLFQQDLIKADKLAFSVVSEFEDKPTAQVYAQIEEKTEDGEVLENYYSFSYPNKKFSKVSYKNSVTGVSKLNHEEEEYFAQPIFENESTEEDLALKEKRDRAIEIGNSYHEALKLIDFDAVENMTQLEEELKRKKRFLSENCINNIDKVVLLKNILLIKSTIGDADVYKEKEFIMQSDPVEIGIEGSVEENSLVVQGIVDLFAIGEKLILIDYKYTSIKNESDLILRYKGQLDLYKLALEKALGRKVDEVYLLSLKEAKLIKI